LIELAFTPNVGLKGGAMLARSRDAYGSSGYTQIAQRRAGWASVDIVGKRRY
jgi:hypothetical protein